MLSKWIQISLIFVSLVSAMTLFSAQAEDSFLDRYAATYRFRLGRPSHFTLTPDGKSILFLRSEARSFVKSLYLYDVAAGRERLLLTADTLLAGASEKLSQAEIARRERQRQSARGISGFELTSDGKALILPLSGKIYYFDLRTKKSRLLGPETGSVIAPRLSPDDSRIAYVSDGNLFVMSVANGSVTQLTQGAGAGISFGEAEFVAQEEMSRNRGFWWSPDSKSILYQRTDVSALETMKIMDAVHPDREPARWRYPRPGKANAKVTLGIIPAGGGESTWIDWDRSAYEYVTVVRWPSRGRLTVTVQNRRQREQLLLAIDPTTGKSQTLITETDEAWVEVEQSVPHWIQGGKEFLWITEQRGALQLERRSRDGELLAELNLPSFGLQALEFVDEPNNRVLVRASVDPTQSALWWLSLESGKPRPFADAEGTWSVSGASFPCVVTRQSADQPPSYRIFTQRGDSGKQIASAQEKAPVLPRLQFVRVGEQPEFDAVIVRPSQFDKTKKYPVIVHVYGGPTSQMVRQEQSRYLFDQWIADQGYIVVAIDGRGTPGRGRDWNRAVRHDLITQPLADQAHVVKLLGKRFAEMDLTRVGIYGWSFGGYFSAMAVMQQPELFKVGVAGAPVVDWADYDTHYTERYMNLPADNPDGYRASNVLTFASQLQRPLMVIHGTADDNVYLVHSLKLTDALLRGGKDFTFVPLSGQTHSPRDPEVTRELWRKVLSYFSEHLQPE